MFRIYLLTLHLKATILKMRKFIFLIPLLLLASCGEYNKVLKSNDIDYKFDYAKRAFEQRKFTQSTTLLEPLIVPLRGGPKGEEALFLLAMSYYENKDYLNSGINFKTYYSRYPKGKFADYFPNSDKVTIAQNAMFEMQDKLTLKELQNAQLYYNLGNYMGNNYESAIITAQNALKTYPYSKYREDFEMLILKAKYQEARQSVEEKKQDRYQDVVDEYFSFINNYPESKNRGEADNIYNLARRHVSQ